MALTEDERRKALRILDELDKQTRTKILELAYSLYKLAKRCLIPDI